MCAQGVHISTRNYPQPLLDNAELNVDQPGSSSHESAVQEISNDSTGKKLDIRSKQSMGLFANLHYLAACNEGLML